MPLRPCFCRCCRNNQRQHRHQSRRESQGSECSECRVVAPAAVYLLQSLSLLRVLNPRHPPPPHAIVCLPKPMSQCFATRVVPNCTQCFECCTVSVRQTVAFSFGAALEHALERRRFLGVQKLLEVCQNVRARGGQVAQETAHMVLCGERLHTLIPRASDEHRPWWKAAANRVVVPRAAAQSAGRASGPRPPGRTPPRPGRGRSRADLHGRFFSRPQVPVTLEHVVGGVSLSSIEDGAHYLTSTCTPPLARRATCPSRRGCCWARRTRRPAPTDPAGAGGERMRQR